MPIHSYDVKMKCYPMSSAWNNKGPYVLSVFPVVMTLASHRDGDAKALRVPEELHTGGARWAGPLMNQRLSNFKPSTLLHQEVHPDRISSSGYYSEFPSCPPREPPSLQFEPPREFSPITCPDSVLCAVPRNEIKEEMMVSK